MTQLIVWCNLSDLIVWKYSRQRQYRFGGKLALFMRLGTFLWWKQSKIRWNVYLIYSFNLNLNHREIWSPKWRLQQTRMFSHQGENISRAGDCISMLQNYENRGKYLPHGCVLTSKHTVLTLSIAFPWVTAVNYDLLQARTRSLIMGGLLKSVEMNVTDGRNVSASSSISTFQELHMTLGQVSRDFSTDSRVSHNRADTVAFLVGKLF